MMRINLAAILILLGAISQAPARTIILDDSDCERMAYIQEVAPRWGWGGYPTTSTTQSNAQFYLTPDRAAFICFPLDRIPKGQKIVKAELSFTVVLQSGGEQRVHLRRIIAPWGPGVCWQYRAVRPKREEWTKPGARGAGTDRALKPSAILRTTEIGVKTVNVTEDVELWYTGSASNQGWMLNIEDPDVTMAIQAPFLGGRGSWKLRITYEPE